MFTISTALIISSLFSIVILFKFTVLAIEKGIDMLKKIKDF
jgi:hypothetical protein